MEMGDVGDAVRLAMASMTYPQYEDPDDVGAYWAAVERTRVMGGDVLVAEIDHEVVGLCQVMVLAHFQHTGGWCCEVETVHVRADVRNRGVGTALLEAAEALARERGCYRIQLTSNITRPDAHRFYERQGYTPSHQGFKKYLA
jgi:GNAT superfamily N-acetyltransferase